MMPRPPKIAKEAEDADLISAEEWDRLTDVERDWARRLVGSE